MARSRSNQPASTASAVVNIDPPKRTAGRTSSVPASVASAMAEAIQNGWTTNGQTYDSKESAQSEAAKHKRAISAVMNREEKEIATRAWETSDGVFVFAVGIKPAKTNGNSDES